MKFAQLFRVERRRVEEKRGEFVFEQDEHTAKKCMTLSRNRIRMIAVFFLVEFNILLKFSSFSTRRREGKERKKAARSERSD
jgi:hypothetical protein